MIKLIIIIIILLILIICIYKKLKLKGSNLILRNFNPKERILRTSTKGLLEIPKIIYNIPVIISNKDTIAKYYFYYFIKNLNINSNVYIENTSNYKLNENVNMYKLINDKKK